MLRTFLRLVILSRSAVTLSWAALALGVAALPAPALAAVASTPMQWSNAAFSDNSQAVEHVTIRGQNGSGHATFIRYSVANAGFKRGALTVTFRQESPQGTIFAEETFAKGAYSVGSDKLRLTAGKHSLEVSGGTLTAQFDFGGTTATATLTSGMSPFSVVDKGGDGYIWRELSAPHGRLAVSCAQGSAKQFTTTATAFAVHEASTVTAHQIYDKALRVTHFSGPYVLIDYIVLPKSRGSRPLGFMVVAGKGASFAGEVAKESREQEKTDAAADYQVPYLISVLGKRGAARAAIKLTGDKQVGREDDLADLNWAARKAVGALMHPITYTIKAAAVIEVQPKAEEPPVVLDAALRYKYAQTR